jgi:hemolysin D
MVVVPDDSKLEVEAMLPNRDAGFVHAGETAELKVEAFTYTRYGLLHGTVRSVSRDALRKEQDAPAPIATHLRQNRWRTRVLARPTRPMSARISLAESSVRPNRGRCRSNRG